MSASVIPAALVPAAPALVRDFVNTLDHELGTDELATGDGLTSFLTERGLVTGPSRPADADVALAADLRAALHDALERNHDATPAPLPALDDVLARLPVRLVWDEHGVAVAPSLDGVAGALSWVALAAHDAQAVGTWWRLKICAFDECEWAYYDQSKNRSRSYGEFGCGNKVKTRAYRARQRSAGDAT